MKIDLIEWHGGYNKAKEVFNTMVVEGLVIDALPLGEALLQYRREHNIFEEKDVIVFTDSFMHGELMTISWTRDGEVWMDDGAKRCTNLSMIRHTEPEEIQANRRLDQIKCWSCDKTMMHKQRSENDRFCIHCNAEVCGG